MEFINMDEIISKLWEKILIWKKLYRKILGQLKKEINRFEK